MRAFTVSGSVLVTALALTACTIDQPTVELGEPAPPSCADDPSTCWRGVHGTARLGDNAQTPGFGRIDLGSGIIEYSQNLPEKQRGFLYTDPRYTSPPLFIGNVAPNPCKVGRDVSGYEGPTSVRQLALLSNVQYDVSERPVIFGTEESDCYRGLMTYRQGGRYGVIRFVHMDPAGLVDIEYWVGEPGVDDFRNAPELPR